MIIKSAKIYLIGFIAGTAFCFLLIRTFPEIYLAFIKLLIGKMEAQIGFGRSFHLSISTVIILNNVSASFIMSYGGTLLSRIYMTIRSGTMKTYYLFLHVFPVFILFLNGFVLGAFLLLYLTYYSERVFEFLSALFPHGVFEIPGIILAGAIGLKIAELGRLDAVPELKSRMNNVMKGTFGRYLVAVILLVVGGIVEGSRM